MTDEGQAECSEMCNCVASCPTMAKDLDRCSFQDYCT